MLTAHLHISSMGFKKKHSRAGMLLFENRPELFLKTRLSTFNESAPNVVVGLSFTSKKQKQVGKNCPPRSSVVDCQVTAFPCSDCNCLRVPKVTPQGWWLVDISSWNGSIFIHFRDDSWVWCSFYHLVVESWRTHIFMAGPPTSHLTPLRNKGL